MGWVVKATSRPLYPWERSGTHYIRDRVLVWTSEENLAPTGFDPRTVQPVVSRYTDSAIRDHIHTSSIRNGALHDLTLIKLTVARCVVRGFLSYIL
jgi:hypothetical protein